MNDWIDWDGTNGGYPETLDTRVEVKFRDGGTSDPMFKVRFWYGETGAPSESNWYDTGNDWDIVAYRVVSDV